MLSIPDFKQKQFVFIDSTQRKQMSLRSSNLLIKDEDWKTVQQISLQKIFVIFVLWDFTITSKLVDKLIWFGICIYVLWYNLRPKFMINEALQGNFLLREKQYFCNNQLKISKQIIKNKTNNQIELLKKIRNKNSDLTVCIDRIQTLIDKIDLVEWLDSLRWIEWNIAKLFFQRYFSDMGRIRRMPRTRADIINFLLDIGYTYLFYFIESNLNLYWFDIYKWVFHTQFYERKSLVCDLQEPFRCIIDKKIRKMYNLGQISNDDFVFKKWTYTLPFSNQKKYTRLFLQAILEHKIEIFKYIRWYYLAIMKQDRKLLEFKI